MRQRNTALAQSPHYISCWHACPFASERTRIYLAPYSLHHCQGCRIVDRHRRCLPDAIMQSFFRRISISVSTSALITLAVGLCLTALCYASARQIESESTRRLLQYHASGQTLGAALLPASGMSLDTNHRGSLYVLLSGLLSSLLATAYVFQLVSRNSMIARLTGERTAALQFANLRLSEDVAARMHNEKSLRLRERIIEVSANAVILCSADAPGYLIEYVNPAFERITGYAAGEVIGQRLEDLQGPEQGRQDMHEITAALREQREGKAIVRNFRKDGSCYWSELFVAPLRERLQQAMAVTRRSGLPLWVVFIDLDRFKFVNDTLGHDAGDLVLKNVAERLRDATREVDTVARLGGDEFVLLLP